MPSAQIAFVAYDKLDVLGDEIDTVSQTNELRKGRASKARIDFNDDRATLRPPEFNVRWPPAKVESSQTAQRNIYDTLMLVITQECRKGELTTNEMRWRAEATGANCNDLIPHYLSGIIGALCEFFDQYPRRRPRQVLPAQQMGRMFDYLIGSVAQSDTDAAVAHRRLNYHRQPDFRGRILYLRCIGRQAISRHRNA
ncbi:hypothetical protein X772_31120 [Mesorhizobium sp. LSJC280B00]|nr:hypothetical protein X772_31120 [Mesorhizobium sp. LSJC280B00]